MNSTVSFDLSIAYLHSSLNRNLVMSYEGEKNLANTPRLDKNSNTKDIT